MRRIDLTIAFKDDDDTSREERQTVETSYTPELGGEHRVAHILLAELKVMVGEQGPPRHNATARSWLNFPNQPAGIEQYLDVQNSQAIWLELANLVMGAEGDLNLAQAFKALEPPQEPPFGDDVAINDLYYLHDRKITLLNQTVHALVKVQDLVNRLLHESLGGNLVDTTKPEWERTQLTRKNVRDSLEAKHAAGTLSQADFDAIAEALAIPDAAPRRDIAVGYRNRLMHHVRPSVDYAMFYSALQSRLGEEIRDALGNVVGRRHVLRAREPVQYSFVDLCAAFSEYLDATAAMLDKLSRLAILRR
jgi:hypothetical protein